MKVLARVMAVILLAVGFVCVAQPVTTEVKGTVTDRSGAAISGAEVAVMRDGTGLTRLHSDQEGRFAFAAPTNSTYEIDIKVLGFQELRGKNFSTDGVPRVFVLDVARNDCCSDPVYSEPLMMMDTETSTLNSKVEPVSEPSTMWPKSMTWEYGALVQGGVGLEDRTDYSFFSAGGHLGRVLTDEIGTGLFKGTFEYAVEVFPVWQSYTPKFQKLNCPVGATVASQCKGPTTSGGTYRGVSVTPIILRWNYTHGTKIMPWIQGAGGLIYTTRKYPGIGSLNVGDPSQTGPAADTSVWNFDPQFGIGMHYFLKSRRSLDFSANAVHISSSSLGDKNPGVNTGVQFSVGYAWWK